MKQNSTLRNIVAIAIATTAITTMAACYKAADPVNCFGGSVDDACTAQSPNCSSSQSGTVSALGSRSVVEDGTPGKESTKNEGYCKYRCKITSDCAGKTVTVDVNGSNSNIVPHGSACST